MNVELNLAKQCALGDRYAQQKLYDQYYKFVIAVCMKNTNYEAVDDCIQECWIKILNQIKSFKGHASLKTWIYRVCINQITQYHRYLTTKNRSIVTDGIDLNLAITISSEQNLVEEFIYNSKVERLYSYIDNLPRQQKRIVQLKLEDKVQSEINEELSITVGSIRSTYFKALKNLRRQYASV